MFSVTEKLVVRGQQHGLMTFQCDLWRFYESILCPFWRTFVLENLKTRFGLWSFIGGGWLGLLYKSNINNLEYLYGPLTYQKLNISHIILISRPVRAEEKSACCIWLAWGMVAWGKWVWTINTLQYGTQKALPVLNKYKSTHHHYIHVPPSSEIYLDTLLAHNHFQQVL